MLDSAANRSVILNHLAEKLDAKTLLIQMEVTALDHKVKGERKILDLTVKPLDGTCSIDVKNMLVIKIVTSVDDKPPTNADIQNCEYLKELISFLELADITIGLIISAEYA